MKRIFFSQRFSCKSESQIEYERNVVRSYFSTYLGCDIEIIDQYHLTPEDDDPLTWNWAQETLLLLGEADHIVFCNDWEEALGCRMEMLACKKYRLPFTIMPQIGEIK